MAHNEQPSGKKVKILTDWQAAPDGVTTHDYKAGDEHEVGTALMPEDLAHELANCGVISDEEFGNKDSEVKKGNLASREHGSKREGEHKDKGGFSLPAWGDEPVTDDSKDTGTGKGKGGSSSKSQGA